MSRVALLSTLVLFLLAAMPAPAAAPDYTGPLMKLSQLASDGKFREAIGEYQRLQAQPGTPAWLRAAAEYEMAELYGAMHETDQAIAALGRSVQLGYDDCLAPRTSERLAGVLKSPATSKALAGMKIAEADLRELAWLKQEVAYAEHDAHTMIIDNVVRVDQQSTDIPQAILPTRPTASPAVLYWRQQLLMIQRAQREFVQSSDEERMVHAATMDIAAGAASSAPLESARAARVAAESRAAQIRKRAFVPQANSSGAPKSCSELAAQ